MPDTDAVDNTSGASGHTWVPFAEQPAKRKRAEAVCVHCHSRKVKCDIQTRRQRGQPRCSNCHAAERPCELRPSRRGKRKRSRTECSSTQRHAHSLASGGENARPTVQSAPSVTSASNVDHPSPIADPALQRTPGRVSATDQQFTPLGSIEGVRTQRSHENDVDAGYLHVYGPENQFDAEMQEFQAQLAPTREADDALSLDSGLQSTYLETYFESCYCFCPVLDRATAAAEVSRSPMLRNALALAASHVRPPLLPHDGPQTYYDRARKLFYEDHEPDNVIALQALSLFYWWAPRAPSTIHRHTSWWWQSVIIRHAQQMGIHREPPPESPLHVQLNLSLRRRIWWTAFARERLTALCQSKPCIIDESDCTITPPCLSDFPDSPQEQRKGLIFIHWVRLCRILGHMAKSSTGSGSAAFYPGVVNDFAEWVSSVPPEIRLHLESARSPLFDPDVYQLHLPYLTAVILLHLRRSTQDLPQALPPAILAASCIAKIMRKILARGNARFMMAITCWYSGTAFIALLQGSRIPQFAKEAEDGIAVLFSMVEQLQKMWPTANVIRQGFDRLKRNSRRSAETCQAQPTQTGNNIQQNVPSIGADASGNLQVVGEEVDWTTLLPFATEMPNEIAGCLLRNKQSGNVTRGMPSPANTFFYENVMNEYNDFLDPLLAEYPADFSDLSLFQV